MRAPTKMELKMGGAVELWERRTDGGLGCEEKTDSEEGHSIGFLFFFLLPPNKSSPDKPCKTNSRHVCQSLHFLEHQLRSNLDVNIFNHLL